MSSDRNVSVFNIMRLLQHAIEALRPGRPW